MTGSMDALNAGCFCASLDEARLDDALAAAIGDASIVGMVRERCPHAFSARPVFVSADRLEVMARVVSAIETVVALPAWRELVLSRSPAIAARAQGRASATAFAPSSRTRAILFSAKVCSAPTARRSTWSTTGRPTSTSNRRRPLR